MEHPHIHGVIPPMLTPFKANGDVDYAAHIGNLRQWNSDQLGGYLVLGSNSEAAYLSDEEKLALIEITTQNALPGRCVIAGTGLESTRETIRLSAAAARKGAHAVLILTPCYYGAQMGDEALIRHYRQVADASDVPVLIYNVPVYTHVSISLNAVRALSEHPNIAGMKESTADVGRISSLLNAVPDSFRVIIGSAAAWFPALVLGIRAGILAVSNFAGNECAMVQTLCEQGQHEQARQLFLQLLPVNAAVTTLYGIAGLKEAATQLGYHGGEVRSPLVPLKEPAREHLKEILSAAGLHPRRHPDHTV